MSKKELETTLARFQAMVDEREKGRTIQLPLWPEPKRGAPNSFIRSALFAAIQGKDREYLKDKVLASQDGITVRYTGEQLNQTDLDVWETIVHMAREHPLGDVCTFTAYSMLKALGMETGKADYQMLDSTILRLIACAVDITHEGRSYAGPLVKSRRKDETTRYYNIELNRELIKLFGENQWTALDWAQRQSIRKKPLAQALHAYFSSHRRPYPIKLGTLQAYTASRNKQIAGFKRQVVAALQQLVDIGFLVDFTITGDLVTVTRAFGALPPR